MTDQSTVQHAKPFYSEELGCMVQPVPANFNPMQTGQFNAAWNGQGEQPIQQATPAPAAEAAPVDIAAAVKAHENRKEIRCVPRWGLTPFLLSTVMASSSILLTGVMMGQHANAQPTSTTATAPADAAGKVQAPNP